MIKQMRGPMEGMMKFKSEQAKPTLKTSTSSRTSSSVCRSSLGRTITFWTVPLSADKHTPVSYDPITLWLPTTFWVPILLPQHPPLWDNPQTVGFHFTLHLGWRTSIEFNFYIATRSCCTTSTILSSPFFALTHSSGHHKTFFGMFDSYKESGIRGIPVSGIPEIYYEFGTEHRFRDE